MKLVIFLIIVAISGCSIKHHKLYRCANCIEIARHVEPFIDSIYTNEVGGGKWMFVSCEIKSNEIIDPKPTFYEIKTVKKNKRFGLSVIVDTNDNIVNIIHIMEGFDNHYWR